MSRLPINLRLLLGFLIVAVLPLAGLAGFYLSSFEQALTTTVLQNVASIASKKADQIDTFIDERLANARTYARREGVRDALVAAGRAFQHGGLPATTEVDHRLRLEMLTLLESAPYYDLLLIDASGDVVFSIMHEADLGTNLLSGPYRDTGLAQGFRQAVQTLDANLTPFRPYGPSNNLPAGFAVAPVIDAGGHLLGALALQINLDALVDVVTDRTGLGLTGETGVAQRDGDEVMFTVPLRHVPDAAFRYRQPFASTPFPMQRALSGECGRGVAHDYVGNEIAAAWRYLPALGWGMVAKIDTAEAFAPARDARRLTWLALAVFLLLSGIAATLFGRWFGRTQESVHLYANVFEHSGEGIVITDRDNRIVAVNRAFTDLTGYTIEDVRGENPRVLASGRTPSDVYRVMWESLKSAGFWQGELWDRRKDGSLYPKWAAISLVRDAAGNLTHHIASFTDISERKANEERIYKLAHHDVLTGLFNRYSLQERLEQTLLSAQREEHQSAVMFIDLDRFKVINDTLGHHIGDALLVEVARRLTACVRESDIVARLGGDEFVVVLTGVESGMTAAASIAGKILHRLGEPYRIDTHELHSTPSIGISIYPADGSDAETLMKNADTAMYHAKQQGRNNCQFFTAAMNETAGERMRLERDLRAALAAEQFELHYQPQVRTAGGRICGVEALVRWRHPEQGLVPPMKFIPIAEETGLIEALGAWVLDEACRQLAAWRAQGIESVRMAVNLSAHQLRSAELVQQVRETMARHGIVAGQLELEVTESAAMDNPERAIGQLRALRELGVDLAIDDFGTGYSSLAYLKLLPIQTLKLDRTFVRDIESDENDAAISAATLALARNLGLKVVAEGVETEGQRAFLASHQCDYLQGYLFGMPMPAASLQDTLPRGAACDMRE